MGFSTKCIPAVIAALAGLSLFTNWSVDYLWLKSLHHLDVFWRIRLLKVTAFAATLAIVFPYLLINARLLSSRLDIQRLLQPQPGLSIPGQANLRRIIILIALGVALLIAYVSTSHWDTLLRFYWSQSFGVSDPIYGKDIGFYLFVFPFLEYLQDGLLMLTFVVSCLVVTLYLMTKQLQISWSGGIDATSYIRWHVVANIALYLFAMAMGFFLDRYALLFSPDGAVYGAGYVDVYIMRTVLLISAVLLTLVGIAILIPRVNRRRGSLFAILGCYAIFVILGLGIIPWAVQGFRVEPNELELETEFLRHNIKFTRMAYGLDHIALRSYETFDTIDTTILEQNRETTDNIRLWDWRPLTRTFRQLQQIRTYYTFNDVDVDRYQIGSSYRQVMLAARELSDVLPGKMTTWVNRHLQYTHGYGLAMSFAAEKDNQGSPVLVIKDLPPRASGGLVVTQPEIYYGEKTSGYRIVSSLIREFDYPRGDENIYSHYGGHGGIPIDSMWRRLLFAWHEFDFNIFLTSYIGPDSRLQIRRDLQERVEQIAPFLRLDQDPYLVLGDNGLYWIQDAYTVSSWYPYSQPYQGEFNYIRNSVKVVVDAYDGNVEFYVMDSDDPVLRVYRESIPALFKPINEMPADIHRHIRYPVDLFEAQLDIYNTYHMTVPQVFYNGEDIWTHPREKYGGEQIQMRPYYVLMRLPNETRLQFLLMLPLTPNNRDNMIAWIAARCDNPGYGELIVYKLPKERLYYGPIQVEALIDQDTLISQQLSLWDQRGSRVVRGNILVIPIDHAFIYVEPVYLIAEGTDIPQLKRIIVSDGSRLAMEPSLDQALASVFGDRKPGEPESPIPSASGGSPAAINALQAAEEALKRGDWDTFGRAMQDLKDSLDE